MFEFALEYVGRPDDYYYVTRWDLAKAINVFADTQQEAINKAEKALGSAGAHRHWVFRVNLIQEVPRANTPAVGADVKPA